MVRKRRIEIKIDSQIDKWTNRQVDKQIDREREMYLIRVGLGAVEDEELVQVSVLHVLENHTLQTDALLELYLLYEPSCPSVDMLVSRSAITS